MAKRLTENARRHLGESLTIRWGTSRGRDTWGYTTCSLRNHRGQRLAACNGGGYDMRGTVIGHWIAATFPRELCKLKPADFPMKHGRYPAEDDHRELYGLTYHDPNYDPGKAVIGEGCQDRTLGGAEGQTVAEAEAANKSFGLERYQAIYRASSPVPTARHTVPSIDGGCGISSVLDILRAIGLTLRKVADTKRLDVYIIDRAK